MSEETSLLEMKRNSIKDTPKSEPTSDNVVELMEKECEMTKEFKRFKENNMNCSVTNNMITVGHISWYTIENKGRNKPITHGLWFRMNDKLQRVKTLIMTGRNSAVKDEPLEDAYLDVSNYGIMATLVGRGKWGK